MKLQPNRNYVSQDSVYTPVSLALSLAKELRPSGVILEPCEGSGAFSQALEPFGTVITLEKDRGDDFGFWSEHVDWVITNPPWSNFRVFLSHALEVSDNVAFLATVNHWWTKRRVSDVQRAGFGYRSLLLCDWPVEWPSSGFQLGMMHIAKGYQGPLHVNYVKF